jgi:hypothetical protein
VVRRRHNPFAAQRKRRDDPLRKADQDELEAVMLNIASGGEYVSYAGTDGDDNGCRVFAFDTPEKAQAMQSWIDASGIASRPRPQPPDFPQLKVGSH